AMPHHDAERMARVRDAARQLELTRNALNTDHVPLRLDAATEWSNSWQDAMVTAARKVVHAIQSCDVACLRITSCTALPVEPTAAVAPNLLSIAKAISGAYGLDLGFAFDPTARSAEAAARKVIELLDKYRSMEAHLSQKYPVEAIRRIDVPLLKAEW